MGGGGDKVMMSCGAKGTQSPTEVLDPWVESALVQGVFESTSIFVENFVKRLAGFDHVSLV